MSAQTSRKRRRRNFNAQKTTNSTSPSNSIQAPAAQVPVANGLMARPIASNGPSNGFIPTHGFPSAVFPLSGIGLSQNDQQQQVFTQLPQPVHVNGSSGNSDLDILERLKREILAGQNPHYTATPRPAYLESLYLGRPGKNVNGSSASAETEPNTVKQVEKVQREVQTDVISAEVPDRRAASPPSEYVTDATGAPAETGSVHAGDDEKPSTPSSTHIETNRESTPSSKDVSMDLSVDAAENEDSFVAAEKAPVPVEAPTSEDGTAVVMGSSAAKDGVEPSQSNGLARNDGLQDKEDQPSDEQDKDASQSVHPAQLHDDHAQSLQRQRSQANDESLEVRTFYEGQSGNDSSEVHPTEDGNINVDSSTPTDTKAVDAAKTSSLEVKTLTTPITRPPEGTAGTHSAEERHERPITRHAATLPPKEERKRSYGRQAWPKPVDSAPRPEMFLTAEETRALQPKATLPSQSEPTFVPLEERIGERTVPTLEERISDRVQLTLEQTETQAQTPPFAQPAARTTPLQERISDPEERPPSEPSTGLPRDLKPSELLEALRNQKNLTDLFKSVKQEPVEVSLSSPVAGGHDAIGASSLDVNRSDPTQHYRQSYVTPPEERTARVPATYTGPRASYPPRERPPSVAELLPREGYHESPNTNTRQPPGVAYRSDSEHDRVREIRKTDVTPSGEFARSHYRPHPPRPNEQVRGGAGLHGSREWRERERASYPASNAVLIPRETYPSPNSTTSRYGGGIDQGYGGERTFKPSSAWEKPEGIPMHTHDLDRPGFVEREPVKGEWHSVGGARDYDHRLPLPPSSSNTSLHSSWIKEEPITIGGGGRPSLSSRLHPASYGGVDDRMPMPMGRREVEHYPPHPEFIPRDSARGHPLPHQQRSPSPYRRAPMPPPPHQSSLPPHPHSHSHSHPHPHPHSPIDDFRPPKRARDEASYYDVPERRGIPPPEFHARVPPASPPPPPPPPASAGSGGYDPRAPLIIPRNEPASPVYPEERERSGSVGYYDSRPPPPPQPPYSGRQYYHPHHSPGVREDRRYNGPPPRTA